MKNETMKRPVPILRNILLAAAGLAATACNTVWDYPSPDRCEVAVNFHLRTPRPATPGTRAVDDDYAVRSLDLLVFHEENGAMVYKYRVAARQITQDENPVATFEALLNVTDRRVKLLAIANSPAGKPGAVDNMAAPVTETKVREELTGTMADADPAAGEFVMTGDVTFDDGISTTQGSISIPMIRVVAKVTVEKAPTVTNLDIRSISVYRSADIAQYFPDADAMVMPDDQTQTFPIVTVASVPDEVDYSTIAPGQTDFPDGLDGVFTTFLNENDTGTVFNEETCIVVGAYYGNDQSALTYYRMDFDTDDSSPVFNPMGQVLRNSQYRFTIQSVAGPGWETPDMAANRPATQLDAGVMAWNNSDPGYHAGDNYVVMSRNGLTLDAVVDHTDQLYITTSGLPFTITSERDPAAGPIDTAAGLLEFQTDLMTISLENADGAQPGQQRWMLKATARTTDVIGDDLFLVSSDGLVNARIPVRRTGDFSVDLVGDRETVPVGGVVDRSGNVTRYVEYEIHVPDGMTWSANITAYGWSSGNNTAQHRGYLLDDDGGHVTTLPEQTGEATLRVGFDRLYYPVLNDSPQVTIHINVDEHSEMNQTIVVAQDRLPDASGPFKVLDMYSSSYGSVVTASYLARYTEYLKATRLIGPTGVVRTFGPVTITATGTGVAAIPAAIDPSFRYIHLGGYATDSYIQQRHNVVNSYWQQWGNDRVFVYAVEQRTDGVFRNASNANTRRTTILSTLGVDYLQPSGTGYVAKITNDPNHQRTAVFRYLTQDGPFGSAPDFASFNYYNDGTSSGANSASLPPTAVPIIFDSRGAAGGCVMLFLDPANGVVYWGDGQFFDAGSPAYHSAEQMANGDRDGYSIFMGNVLAYIVNCAQYGSSFADLFVADQAGNYPLYDAAFP